jgi:hypothetical protein
MVWYLHWLQMWEHLEELNFQLKSDPKQGLIRALQAQEPQLNTCTMVWYLHWLQMWEHLNGHSNPIGTPFTTS